MDAWIRERLPGPEAAPQRAGAACGALAVLRLPAARLAASWGRQCVAVAGAWA